MTQAFIQELNHEAEQNRQSNPSAADTTEQQLSKEEDIKDEKILNLVKANANQKSRRDARSKSGSDRRSTSDNITKNIQRGIESTKTDDSNHSKERKKGMQARAEERSKKLKEI